MIRDANKSGAGPLSEPEAYVGITKCGCIVAAVVDDPKHKKETAKAIASWVRDGLTIERRTCEQVRQGEFGCKHRKDA